MAPTIEPGSRTPSLAEVVDGAITTRLRQVNVAIPARVQAFDAKAGTVDVQPLIKRRVPTRAGTEVLADLPVLTGLPVAWPRGGGFFVAWPLAVGDQVLAVFCDRSLEAWFGGDGARPVDPDDFRTHDLSDGVVIAGLYPPKAALAKNLYDGDHLAMGSEKGATIHVTQDEIRLVAKDGCSIHVTKDEVNLSEEHAADFVALAQKVLTELQNIKTFFDAFFAALQFPIALEPGNGVASVFQAQLITALAAIRYPDPQSVAAEKVKAT